VFEPPEPSDIIFKIDAEKMQPIVKGLNDGNLAKAAKQVANFIKVKRYPLLPVPVGEEPNEPLHDDHGNLEPQQPTRNRPMQPSNEDIEPLPESGYAGGFETPLQFPPHGNPEVPQQPLPPSTTANIQAVIGNHVYGRDPVKFKAEASVNTAFTNSPLIPERDVTQIGALGRPIPAKSVAEHPEFSYVVPVPMMDQPPGTKVVTRSGTAQFGVMQDPRHPEMQIVLPMSAVRGPAQTIVQPLNPAVPTIAETGRYIRVVRPFTATFIPTAPPTLTPSITPTDVPTTLPTLIPSDPPTAEPEPVTMYPSFAKVTESPLAIIPVARPHPVPTTDEIPPPLPLPVTARIATPVIAPVTETPLAIRVTRDHSTQAASGSLEMFRPYQVFG
jgi:hypothetical protein